MTDLARAILSHVPGPHAKPRRLTRIRDEMGYPTDPEATLEFQSAVTELHQAGYLDWYEERVVTPTGLDHQIGCRRKPRPSQWVEKFAPRPTRPFEAPRL